MISGGSLSDRHQCQDHLQYHDGHPQHIIGMIIVLQGDRCISGAEQPRRLARRDRRGNQRDLWCHKEQTASSIPCSLGQRHHKCFNHHHHHHWHDREQGAFCTQFFLLTLFSFYFYPNGAVVSRRHNFHGVGLINSIVISASSSSSSPS